MISAVLTSYELHLRHLRSLVADLTAEQMVAQPVGILNHPAWTIGHLAHSGEAIGGELGLPPWLPTYWKTLFGTGSLPSSNASGYPSRNELLTTLDAGCARLKRKLSELSMTEWEAPLPDIRYRDRLPTIGHAVVHILSGHTALHIGQLTVWRRAMSLGPAPDLPNSV